jgi:hypothetical protein
LIPDTHLLQTPASPLGKALVTEAQRNAERLNKVGYCAKGVSQKLSKFGVNITGHAAHTKPRFDRDSRFEKVSMSHLEPGDIVVRGRSPGHPYGHTFVYLGNGKEASDHKQGLPDGSQYGTSYAYRLRATG